MGSFVEQIRMKFLSRFWKVVRVCTTMAHSPRDPPLLPAQKCLLVTTSMHCVPTPTFLTNILSLSTRMIKFQVFPQLKDLSLSGLHHAWDWGRLPA